MKKRVLFSWLGANEIYNVVKGYNNSIIEQAYRELNFYKIVLFGNLAEDYVYKKTLKPHTPQTYDSYKDIIKKKCDCKVELHQVLLTSPTNLAEIHAAVNEVVKEHDGKFDFFFHISGGTHAMTIIWVFQRNFWGGKLIEALLEDNRKVSEFEIPFEIQTDFIKKIDTALQKEEIIKEFSDIKGISKEIDKTRKMCLRMAQHDSLHLLLLGETGTGKEAFARAIHAASPRKKGKIVSVNCGAIPENLIESILFGHEKGAFTGATGTKKGVFEEAEGGTVFLDEIGDLPQQIQVKLLRAIPGENIKATITRVGGTEEIEVKARIIAATHKNLKKKISLGEFREDLYFRLSVIEINIPPLRARDGDTEYLLDFFFDKYKKEAKMISKKLSKEAKTALLSHSWPGNVRELINTVRRLIYITESNEIKPEDIEGLLYEPYKQGESTSTTSKDVFNRPLFEREKALDELERHFVKKALEISPGNLTRAGKLIGVNSGTAMKKVMKRLGIEAN